MTCEACALAETYPGSGLYHASCNECQTRQIANGLAFHAWKARGAKPESMPKEYAKQLKRITRRGETTRQAHERVKAWAVRIKG